MENQRWFDLLRFSTTMPSVNAKAVMKKSLLSWLLTTASLILHPTTAQLQAKVDDPNLIYHHSKC
jgi:hypothetical protein